jgi:hypothetical protein
MEDTPKIALLRRGQVKEWLGLDDNEVTKWIEEGILKPKYFRTGSRAFFIRKDIEILINSEASI